MFIVFSIGQKGIGFKSVFRVTNRPEIHSNGFHLCFDVDSGPMGYILPHWCEDNNPQEEYVFTISIICISVYIKSFLALCREYCKDNGIC